MHKLFLAVLILIVFFSGCDKKAETPDSTTDTKSELTKKETPPTLKAVTPENILGSWINTEDTMGFELYADGRAASVNMATLDYVNWELIENKLMMVSKSKGVSNPVTTKEIYIIREIYPDSMIVSPSDNPDAKWTYIKK